LDLFYQGLQKFYIKNQQELLQKHPGLTYQRLKNEVEASLLRNSYQVTEGEDFYMVPPLKNSLEKFLTFLQEGTPLAYITGRSFFYNSEFIVDRSCLIPRYETEVLVEDAIKELKVISKKLPRVADVGTGSGAIILAIMREIDFPIEAVASDISEQALEVAKKNYFHLEFTIPRESTIDFICRDRLEGEESSFDLIVSNPPYIKQSEDGLDVHEMVHAHEPHQALYLVDSEYEQWFQLFLRQVFSKLNPGGTFLMEGHERQLKDLAQVAKQIGFEQVEIILDLTGRDRILKGKRK
jgi:release factor glutamine methyltransferase